jgi:hypothetical protein
MHPRLRQEMASKLRASPVRNHSTVRLNNG